MTFLSVTRPIDFIAIPSLADLAKRFVPTIAKAAAPRKTAGLSFADISDASARVTVKGGLKVCRKPHGVTAA